MDDGIAKRLGHHVRSLRLNTGITQEELAERVGVHPTYIAKIEVGTRLPSMELLYRLAEALHTRVSDIVKETDQAGEPISHVLNQDEAVQDIVAQVKACGPRQRRFVRDFVLLLRRSWPSNE